MTIEEFIRLWKSGWGALHPGLAARALIAMMMTDFIMLLEQYSELKCDDLKGMIRSAIEDIGIKSVQQGSQK